MVYCSCEEVLSLKKLFPIMLDEPEAHSIATGVAYWVLAFFLCPAFLSLSTITTAHQPYYVWLEIGYHVLNFLVVFFTFFRYLKDAFFLVQVNTKQVLGTAVSCAAVIIFIKLAIWIIAAMSKNALFAQVAVGSFLTTEADLLYYSTAVLTEQPLWGTLCLILLEPFIISCLFYATAFAPICTSRPLLAYLAVTVLFLLLNLVLAFCLWSLEVQLAIYLVQLPVHLIACWAYQKTDTVWTPILIHFLTNSVLAFLSFGFFGML